MEKAEVIKRVREMLKRNKKKLLRSEPYKKLDDATLTEAIRLLEAQK